MAGNLQYSILFPASLPGLNPPYNELGAYLLWGMADLTQWCTVNYNSAVMP